MISLREFFNKLRSAGHDESTTQVTVMINAMGLKAAGQNREQNKFRWLAGYARGDVVDWATHHFPNGKTKKVPIYGAVRRERGYTGEQLRNIRKTHR